jgi:hypothetical protein
MRDRLARHTVKRPSGCWEWSGALNNKGYGVISLGGGRVAYAHRVSYAVHREGATVFDKKAHKYLVCHRCDNPKCINPHHLFKGTHKTNYEDMRRKGRRAVCSRGGEAHPSCTLPDAAVERIRAVCAAAPRYTSGRILYGVVRDLAAEFGVSSTHISEIHRNLTRTRGTYVDLQYK